jgi:hypothetical protein
MISSNVVNGVRDNCNSYDKALMTVYAYLFGVFDLSDLMTLQLNKQLSIFLLYIYIFFILCGHCIVKFINWHYGR